MPRTRSLNNMNNMDRTNVERDDQTMGANPKTDDATGAEGIEQVNEDQSTENERQQGRESTDGNGANFSGQGDQREGAENPEGTGYTQDKK